MTEAALTMATWENHHARGLAYLTPGLGMGRYSACTGKQGSAQRYVWDPRHRTHGETAPLRPQVDGAEGGDARAVRLLLEACMHSNTLSHSCLLPLSHSCQPLTTLLTWATCSSKPLPGHYAAEQALTSTHHPAPSSWLQSH